MKTYFFVLLLCVISLFNNELYAYRDLTSKDHTVMINVTVESTPSAKINLSWLPNDSHRQYMVYRKLDTDVNFPQNPIATLDSGVCTYTDATAKVGLRYTYKVQALGKANYSLNNYGPFDFVGFGYTETGIEAKEYEMGKVLLLVDSTVYEPLFAQITRLIKDMENEGWAVVTKQVTRAEKFDKNKVKQVKKVITDEYAKDKKLTTVFLLGRVPVPYSGISNTDGHGDHIGAWPSDMFYGDMDNSSWTDMNVNNSTASREENRNIPGDGKYDIDALQNTMKIELAVGRVDLYNMPLFHKQGWEKPEIELLKAYLNKDHNYRIGKKDFPKKGIITDNFAANGMPEGFASSGWRNLATLCGNENVSIVPGGTYLSSLTENKYLWAYGTGPGSYTSCGGVGGTPDFVGKNINAVFTMLFGSYFGDWDIQNNILRAALCSDSSALTCCWDGRPHWYFHEMGLGKPIGKAVTTSQNNYFTYLTNLVPNNGNWAVYEAGITGRHMCFLGDPTLRMDSYLNTSVQNLAAVQYSKNSVKITWDNPSTENAYYCNVYRRYAEDESWVKVNNAPIKENELLCDVAQDGRVYFQVRTEELISSNSGSYYANGKSANVDVAFSSEVDDNIFNLSATPNPATSESRINLSLKQNSNIKVEIYNQNGQLIKLLYNGYAYAGEQEFVWNLKDEMSNEVTSGVYFIRIHTADGSLTDKIIVR